MSNKLRIFFASLLASSSLFLLPTSAYAVNLDSFNIKDAQGGSAANSCTAPCSLYADWSTDANTTYIYVSSSTGSPTNPYGGQSYGSNNGVNPVTLSFATAGTYYVWISGDYYNQSGNTADWGSKQVTISAASPIPTPVNNNTSSNNNSSNNSNSSNNNSSNNSNSNNTSSSPVPNPSPSPSPRASIRPSVSPSPNLFPSPNASDSAVLGLATDQMSTPEPQVAGTSTENNNINPFFIVIPTVLLGLVLMVYFFKDRLATSMQTQMANRKRARLMKMIASKQDIPQDTPLN